MNTLQNINLMKNKIILFLMISFALTSCKNEVEPKENATRIIPFTEVGMKMREEAAAKAAKKDSQTATNTTAVAVGMNPEHGQKGHRCDIPVGAPLNSPAVAAKTPALGVSLPVAWAIHGGLRSLNLDHPTQLGRTNAALEKMGKYAWVTLQTVQHVLKIGVPNFASGLGGVVEQVTATVVVVGLALSVIAEHVVGLLRFTKTRRCVVV